MRVLFFCFRNWESHKTMGQNKNNLQSFLWIALLAVFFGAVPLSIALSAEAERSIEILLTKKEALALAFPGADEIRKVKKWLTDSQIAAIAELSGQKFNAKRLKFYIGIKNGQPMGTMSIGNEIGRSYPITFMVVINPDGTVKDVEVMVYREPHGWEVRFDSFLSQFFGQSAQSPFDNIHNITGATLSVRSMTRGIKKAVAAYQVLFLDQVE